MAGQDCDLVGAEIGGGEAGQLDLRAPGVAAEALQHLLGDAAMGAQAGRQA
jgi:hypothetical protein